MLHDMPPGVLLTVSVLLVGELRQASVFHRSPVIIERRNWIVSDCLFALFRMFP